MFRTTCILSCGLAFVPLGGHALIADEPASAEAAAASPPATEIEAHIKALDSDKFQDREQASKKLAAAGESAVDALAKAASEGSREASNRALEALKVMAKADVATGTIGGRAAARDKAKAALAKLAKNENASLARRADQILNPPEPPVQQPPPFGGRGQIGRIQVLPGGNIQIVPGGGNIQIGGGVQIGGLGGNAFRMQNVNGKKTIDAEENGKKIHIEDDPQNGISISITEKVDGQEKTSKYAAKNAEELKKAHPDAEKIYQKYSGQNGAGAIQIQIQGLPGLPPVAPPPVEPAAKKQAAEQLSDAQKRLTEAGTQLKKHIAEKSGDAGPAAELKRALEEVEAAAAKLDELQKTLEK